MVRLLLPHRVGGRTHLRAEHFKKWWREAYLGEQLKILPTDGALAVSGRHCAAHVAHGGYTTGVGMNYLDPNSKRDHRHTGHRPARDTVQGGVGTD